MVASRSLLRTLLGSLAAFGVLLFVNSAYAAIAYVSPGGTGNCSQPSPCSFATGLSQAGVGGTVYLVTTSSNNFGNVSISNSVNVIGTNQTIRANITISPATSPAVNTTPIYVLIKGLDFTPGTNYSPAIRVNSVSGQAVSLTVQGSSFRNFNSTSGSNYGAGLYSSGAGQNFVTIQGSTFLNNNFSVVNYNTNSSSFVQAYQILSAGSNAGLVNANPGNFSTLSPSAFYFTDSQIYDGTVGNVFSN